MGLPNHKFLTVGSISSCGVQVAPFFYYLPHFGSIAFVGEESSKSLKIAMIESLTCQLAELFSENLYIHVFDPLEFGASFRRLHKLPAQLKATRVSTSSSELTQTLAELRSRITAVNQDVLSGKLHSESLEDFLAQYGSSNEKIHLFLCNGFPYRWNREQLEELYDVLRLGPRSGVYCLFSASNEHNEVKTWDNSFSDVISHFVNFYCCDLGVRLAVRPEHPLRKYADSSIKLYAPSDQSIDASIEEIISVVDRAKQRTVLLNEEVLAAGLYSRNTISDIRIPVGKRGSGEVQEFVISDQVSSYHALIGGATGSGKTVLLHNIISNGSYLYSPSELQYCLLDYKEGAEFAVYRNNPSVRVLSIESQNEFGLSFLKYIQELIRERGELFKELGVISIKEARQKSERPIPRVLIVIDEFQVLLMDSFKGSLDVAEILDDITKRGRSFGLHLVLSSQSLTQTRLQSSTLTQMPIRMVLKIAKDDCERFLSDGNLEPSFFRRQGQAVYNSHSGVKEDNIYFNVAFLDRKDLSSRNSSLEELVATPEPASSVAKRVFNPRDENAVKLDEISGCGRPEDVVVGSAFYMSSEPHHIVGFSRDIPSNLIFSASSAKVLNEFSLQLISQFFYKNFKITLLCGNRFRQQGEASVEFNRILSSGAISIFGSANWEPALDDIGSLSEGSDSIDVAIREIIIIPDIYELLEFHEANESYDKFTDLLKASVNKGCRFVIGTKNRLQLDDRLSLYQFGPYFSERIVLSPGTDCESYFGMDDLTLSSGMSAHLSIEDSQNVRLFRTYKTESV